MYVSLSYNMWYVHPQMFQSAVGYSDQQGGVGSVYQKTKPNIPGLRASTVAKCGKAGA